MRTVPVHHRVHTVIECRARPAQQVRETVLRRCERDSVIERSVQHAELPTRVAADAPALAGAQALPNENGESIGVGVGLHGDSRRISLGAEGGREVHEEDGRA